MRGSSRDIALWANTPPNRRAAAYTLWHIRLFFAYTQSMKVVGSERGTDWPETWPIHHHRYGADRCNSHRQMGRKVVADAQFSDVDVELDKEVSSRQRISIRVMHELAPKT